jgi:tryptophanase
MFGHDDPAGGQAVAPPLELVRLAIPRRVYTKAQLAYVAQSVIEVHRRREVLRGFRITQGAPFLRHFTATLEELPAARATAQAAART